MITITENNKLPIIVDIASRAKRIGASFADYAFDFLVDGGMNEEDAEDMAYQLESDFEELDF